MKTLHILTEGIKSSSTKSTKGSRGKLILNDTEERSEYIEIDNYSGSGDTYKKREEPVIRIQFSDDQHWTGTMSELKQALSLS